MAVGDRKMGAHEKHPRFRGHGGGEGTHGGFAEACRGLHHQPRECEVADRREQYADGFRYDRH